MKRGVDGAPGQLSLFGDAPAEVLATAAPTASTAPATPAPPPAPVTMPGSPPVAAQPLHPRHADAGREIDLDGQRIGYALRRARRRTIGFVVGIDGLMVHAPKWVGQRDIDAALRAKSGWIVRKVAEQRERALRLQAARVDWRDGTTIPFLGQPVIVVLDPRACGAPGGAVLDAEADAAALPGVPRRLLHVGLPHTAAAAQIRDVVQSWLQRQAKHIFDERSAHFAALLGVRCRRLALSSAQTRWGSASADGTVRLNWRLVHFGMPTIDYVVAHELAHLREMNHSPRFWEVVRSVVPDYEELRGGLKSDALPVFERDDGAKSR